MEPLVVGMPLSHVDTPAVLVDLDRLEGNLSDMAETVRGAGVRLRPHTKTHKSAWIAGEQVRHGASGITVSKLGEAEVMVEAGFDDILLAYPIVGHDKLRRLSALAERVRIAVSTDDLSVAEALAAIGRGLARPLAVFAEVDSGQHRCGRAPGPDAAALARGINELRGLRLAGLMTHAGHSYQATTTDARRQIAMGEARALVETADVLGGDRPDGLELSIGSTPTSLYLGEVAAAFPAVTETRAGSYAFYDANQLATGVARQEQCALTVLATIVSRPAADRAVADAGSKTLAGDGPGSGNTGFGRILGEPRASVERLSEEHAWLRIDPDVPWRIGDAIRIIPNHACVVPNLADTMLGVRGEVVERIIPVDARGHAR